MGLKMTENKLDNLIRLAHIVAKPYLIAVWVLALLLLISIGANIYLFTQNTEVAFVANENSYSSIKQQN